MRRPDVETASMAVVFVDSRPSAQSHREAADDRPRFSTLFALGLVLIAALLAATVVLLDVSARPRGGKTVVTVRLWDEQVAAAYRQSFAEFSRAHPDIEVHTHVVAYSTYFNTLRTDVAGGSADDIFWISNAYLAGYADSGRLIDIGKTLGAGAASAWEPSVVEQFTRGGVLWAVPQLTDAGIALYYNADLLAAAGVDPAELATLRWSPDGGDTLAPAAGPANGRRRRAHRGHLGFRRRADPSVGLQRGQRCARHLPELHRVGRRRVPRR